MEYIVNKNAQMGTGCHKIHTKECKNGPKKENRIELKECMCPLEAEKKAKKYFTIVNGCKYCCKSNCL